MADRTRLGAGPGRALIYVYGLFALSAGVRAAVQIADRFRHAPAAYALSALAAAVYLVAAVALARGARRLAWACLSVELAGVLAVGAASLVWPAAFPEATVWSSFGVGYGFVPLALPLLGLLWLRRAR